MNKQEINEKLKENGAWCTECHTWVTDRYVKIRKALELVGQLDEPQKPVVPKFLDEYIKDNEGQHAADIFSAEWLYEESGVLEEKVAEWLLDDEVEENNRRYLIAVQAFVTGDYEVEKEPLYEVIIGDLYLIKKFNDRNDFCFDTSHSLCTWEKSAYQLTEEEIKAIDERFWLFAVPVDEVVEG